MNNRSIIIFFLVNLVLRGFAQNGCDCIVDKERFVLINQLLDLKEYKKADAELKQVNITTVSCRIRHLQFQTQLFTQQTDLSRADSCLSVLKKLMDKNKCSKAEGKYYLQAGLLLMKKSLYDSALIQLIHARELAELSVDSLGECNALMYMGNIFNYMRQSDKAVEYDRKALQIARLLKESRKEVRILSNMQGHFGVWYDITENIKFIDSIKKITGQTLLLSKKYDLNAETAQTYSVLSGIAFVEEKYRLQLIYTDSALMYLDRSRDFRFCYSVFQKKCDAYIELKDLKKARLFADSSLYFSTKEQSPLLVATSYERLYEVEKLSGNDTKALYFHEQFTSIRDSIRTLDKTRVINEMEQKYNKAENEKKISELAFEKDLLNKEKEIAGLRLKSLAGIVVAIIFILLTVVFFYRQSVIKNKLQKLEIEQRLNRVRMNPHFFFNVLGSIQAMILEEQDSEKSAGMISKFSKIMRQSLESTYNELVTIEEETSFLQNYLDLQKMRYPGKFDYSIDMFDEIDPYELKIPGMVIQPFIENSIEHGFKNISYKGFISVSFIKENNQLKVIVKDNGSGFQSQEKHKSSYPSRATQIIKDRLFLLNQQHKSQARFELNNTAKGIEVLIFLPLLY